MMNKPTKPPLKEKPVIKAKPTINSKPNEEPIKEPTTTKDHDNLSTKNVLDKSRLNKAFQLLNQSNLKTDKDDTRYDIRVDEDQIETCNQIINLLFKAGYLRSNIIGLSEFDKIIGGMCWCIELCNIDIDIDLFYQDSLTIGQKISLTEKIVKVLNIIKCPFPLEPHQIQGLDCISILPVVEWLIKESNEFSLQIKDYLDLYSSYKFDCDHDFSSNKEDVVVISRSKEAKKLIKEYFNKNEIKINLGHKIEEHSAELEKITRQDHLLDKEVEQLENDLKEKLESLKSIDEECVELNKQLVDHQTAEKKELALEYSKLIDDLKQLKSTNKTTKSQMKKEYESLLNDKFEVDDSLVNQLEIEKAKLNKLKLELVDKNKSYLTLRRAYDNVLSKEEMSQYQKRFLELSAQVSNKYQETKKFYILFNQLDNSKKQLDNKFQFFESLLKCFNQLDAYDTQVTDQLIQQLEQKISSLNTTLVNLTNRNQKESQHKQSLEQQYVELVEMKRLYNKYIKEFKEEMMNRRS